MSISRDKLLLINASRFYCVTKHPQLILYCAQRDDELPFSSFSEALNSNNYRSLFHPVAYVVISESLTECVLIRDHLGLRPLYYYYQSGQIIFGNTISDIMHRLSKAPDLLDSEIAHLFGDAYSYTDNTLYKDIYRVEPGHMVHIKTSGCIVKSAFWQLEQEGNTLHYRDDREYLEHFTSLMQESVKNATKSVSSIAAEFSAAMDSTAIYGTCVTLGLNPALFMHEPPTEFFNTQTYNACYEKAVLTQYPSVIIHRIKPSDFNAIRMFQNYSQWLSGPLYVFELFAQPIHEAVSQAEYQILLSGFGVDQGVSSHILTRFIIPSLINGKHFHKTWAESSSMRRISRLVLLAKLSHPLLHQLIQAIQDLRLNTSNAFKKESQKTMISTHPYHRHYFKTLREAEWSFLQGPNSHEVRMRIEYSSIVAKKMGFEYRYPLLHPKLLEFFISLPIEQKRHQSAGRYLMRRYLASILQTAPFNTYKKIEGLNIIPSLDTFKAQWERGVFRDEFQRLPFKQLTQDKSLHKGMIKNIQAFMLNECLNLIH